MDRLVAPSKGSYRVMFLIFALTAMLVLASTAHAQEREPMDNQYQPTVTVEGSGDQATTSPSSGSAEESSGEYGAEVLPATGGPLLPFLALGALALGAAGLLVSRRNR